MSEETMKLDQQVVVDYREATQSYIASIDKLIDAMEDYVQQLRQARQSVLSTGSDQIPNIDLEDTPAVAFIGRKQNNNDSENKS